MNERIVAIIESEFRAMGLRLRLDQREQLALARAARRIVSECDTERRAAARTASFAGAIITRGRTRL